jgi:hypothetical protein
MNLLGMLTRWTDGQLSGNTGWFALAPGQFSGDSGYLALGPAAHVQGSEHRARHATSHLADATDELSRRPGHLSRRPDGLAGLTHESAGRPGHPAEPPGALAGRPGRLSRRPGPSAEPPDQSDGRPGEPEGSGDGARRPDAASRGSVAARREGMDGLRTGLDGPRERGFCARGGGDLALARAVFVPEGRRGVATGGAQGRRPERNPWTGTDRELSAPAGRRSFAGCASAAVDAPFLCPSGAEENMNDAFHGLRIAPSGDAPPVATALDPSGVSGEVPEGRPPHTPLWHQRTCGSEVRRG